MLKSITFPKATVDVAMSNSKLSPLFPGAATAMGLVPMIAFRALIGATHGEVFVNDIPLKHRMILM